MEPTRSRTPELSVRVDRYGGALCGCLSMIGKSIRLVIRQIDENATQNTTNPLILQT